MAQPTRREEMEAWWAFLARIMAFLLGVGILSLQAITHTMPDPYPWLVGPGLMGPTVAASVAQVVTAFRGESRR